MFAGFIFGYFVMSLPQTDPSYRELCFIAIEFILKGSFCVVVVVVCRHSMYSRNF
jgi:hypothetical protein